jgi:hypothetical protein
MINALFLSHLARASPSILSNTFSNTLSSPPRAILPGRHWPENSQVDYNCPLLVPDIFTGLEYKIKTDSALVSQNKNRSAFYRS